MQNLVNKIFMTKNDLGYKCDYFHSQSFDWVVQGMVYVGVGCWKENR